jgi:hypothetical protein
VRALVGSVIIVDDRGARSTLSERGASGEVLGTEMLMHLRVDPVPGPEARRVELRGRRELTAPISPRHRGRPARGRRREHPSRQPGVPPEQLAPVPALVPARDPSQCSQHKKDLITVRAEDNRGRRYLASYDRSGRRTRLRLSRFRRSERLCGQGQDRTVDLPLFRRTLVPTELPDLGAMRSTRTNRCGPDGI